MKESDLYQPLKDYLTHQGYEVSSEVKHCDLIAVKGEEVIAVELKTRFSLKLIAQAVRRQEISETVYVAVPVLPGKRQVAGYADAASVLKRLGIGLILVRFFKSRTRVEVAFHPSDVVPLVPHVKPKKRAKILREIDGRFVEFNKAGQSSAEPYFSAHRQQALLIAWGLSQRESASPAELKKLGAGAKTGIILYQNVFGWFERVKRGCYRLSPEGKLALEQYQDKIQEILKRLKGRKS